MTKDINKKIGTVNYNILNLPKEVIMSSATQDGIAYLYDAAGIKLQKIVTEGGEVFSETDYIGNFIYKNGNLDYILFGEGKILPSSTLSGAEGSGLAENTYQYNLTDHLGNVRCTFDETGVQQEDSYYPFGMTQNGLSHSNLASEEKNKYLYNGKELQTDHNLDWHDYGARFYDAQLGRFHTLDRFAEKFSYQSPYLYAGNNPVKYIDVNGDSLFIKTFFRTLKYENGKLTTKRGKDVTKIAYNKKGELRKNFLGKTVGDLQKLQSKSAGNELVNSFQNNESHHLQIRKSPDNVYHESGIVEAGMSVIEYNPYKNTLGTEGFVRLGHEMGHGDDELNGGMSSGVWFTGKNGAPVTNSEKIATHWENKIRAEHRQSLRSYYEKGTKASRILNNGTTSRFHNNYNYRKNAVKRTRVILFKTIEQRYR